MGMDWEGANDCSWGYHGFIHLKWLMLLGALRIKDNIGQAEDIEDLADFSNLQMGRLLQKLPETDPIRKFLLQPGQGKLSPKESAELAARLAEITYFLTIKRLEHEKFIFLPHMAKRRQFQDNQLNQIALLMWECAAAAEQQVEISWDDR